MWVAKTPTVLVVELVGVCFLRTGHQLAFITDHNYFNDHTLMLFKCVNHLVTRGTIYSNNIRLDAAYGSSNLT